MDNLHTVKGVVFSKDVKTGPSKKPGEPDWNLCIMKIEAEVTIKGKDVSSVCEYVFDWGVEFEPYCVKDQVVFEFYFKNRQIKTAKGIWDKEEKRIAWMKHDDITTPPPPKTYGNKVQTGSMSDTSELTNRSTPSSDVFDNPRPSTMATQDDDDFSDMPF